MAHRSQFHALVVSQIERLTEDSVALTFDVPERLAADYQFAPGQHVTVRCVAAGDDGRRTYSLCSPPGHLRIGVKKVEGGVFSTHALERLRLGDEVEVMTPSGHFTTEIDPTRARHRVAIVAGSGITPALSIMRATLECEPKSHFTLVYGNASSRTVMFLDEICDLKDRFPSRLSIIHVLSREPREAQLLSGRIDREKLVRLLDTIIDAAATDEWFLCGPLPLVDVARLVLKEHGVADSAVRFELFHVPSETAARAGKAPGDAPAEVPAETSTELSKVTIVLAGRSSLLDVAATQDVLHAALAVRPDVPYGCTNGMCGTCRAKLVAGKVEMHHCYALDAAELAAGFVLTCQAQPRTQTVTLDYDA
jgi:ring-1,2-phenylacetyl-CoA epoxidase subunit PaaE